MPRELHPMRFLLATFSLAPLLAPLPLGLSGAAPGVVGDAAAGRAPDFQREVLPVLSRACFACHGPDDEGRAADLRLDLRRAATAPHARSGAAPIVPGDPDASELLRRVTSDDADLRMPPPEKGPGLSAEDVDLLRRWIAAGADYAPHWAFVAPVRPAPPAVAQAELVRSPLDAFVLARLEDEGLAPAPEADRATLARRAALDLTGLPPAPEALAAFLADDRTDAYERYVDALLADPGYGERWARVWLDLARYADSAGYGSDPLRTIWRWRDWVIEAFDRNLPYDRFTLEQMAGDLLPDATVEQRLATAFHRNSMTNTEGGTDDEEFRVAAVKDRVETTMSVWMGLTARCAQCHNHKYDPLSQREYYRLFAFFDSTADADRNDDSPRLATPTRADAARLAELDEALQAARASLAAPRPDDEARRAAWCTARRADDAAWRPLRPVAATTDGGDALLLEGDVLRRSAPARPGWEGERWLVDLELPPGRWTGLRLEALADPALPGGGPGLSPRNGNFVVGEVELSLPRRDPGPPRARFVRLALTGPDRILSLAEVEVLSGGRNVARAGVATQSSTDYGGDAARAIDGDRDGAHDHGSVTHTAEGPDPWWELALPADTDVEGLVVALRTDGNLHRRSDGLDVTLLDAERRVVWRAPRRLAEREPRVLAPAREPSALAFASATATHEQDGFPAAAAIDGDPGARRGWAIGGRQGTDQHAVLALAEPLVSDATTRVRLELAQGFGGAHVLGRARVSATQAPDPRALPDAVTRALRAGDDGAPEVRAAFLTEDPARDGTRASIAALERERAGFEVVTTPVLVELPPDRRRTSHVLHKGSFLDPGDAVTAGVPAALHAWPAGAPLDRSGLARWLVSPENPLTARVWANRLWAQLFGVGLVETEEDFGSQGALPSHPELLDWLAVELVESGWDTRALLRTLVCSATYRRAAVGDPEALARDPRNRLYARGPRFRLEAETIRDQALAVAGLLSRKRFGPPVFPPQPDGLWRAAFNGERNWVTSAGEDRYRRALYTLWRRTIPYPSLAVFDAPSRETCTPRRFRTNTPLQAFVTLNDPVYVEAAQALARRMLREGGATDEQRAAHGLWLCLAREPRPDEVRELVALAHDARAQLGDPVEARRLACDPLGPLPDDLDVREAAAWTAVANVLLNLDEFLTKP